MGECDLFPITVSDQAGGRQVGGPQGRAPQLALSTISSRPVRLDKALLIVISPGVEIGKEVIHSDTVFLFLL